MRIGELLSTKRVNLALWGLVLFAVSLLGLLLNLPGVVFFSLAQAGMFLVFIGLLQLVYERLDRKMDFGMFTALSIIGLSLVASVLHSSMGRWVILLSGWTDLVLTPLEVWLVKVVFFWLVYMLGSLLYFWYRAERSARKKDRERERARHEAERMELRMLRSQLDPHFLFNALNGISTVVQAESPHAAEMVRELSDYLRYSLEHQHNATVPLSKELEAMVAYLHVEQARFEEELHIEITTDAEAREWEIPCFVLLPLVENAVKHSFHEKQPPWFVSIVAETSENRLVLEVKNSGELQYTQDERTGVGLEILRRRLNLYYPGRHEFSLTESGETVVARMELEGAPCFE